MADMKIPPGAAQPPALRPMAPARTEAVRAAQRAFFDAALTNAPPAARAAPGAAPPAASAAGQGARAADAIQDSTQRYLRPGSRVDIKV